MRAQKTIVTWSSFGLYRYRVFKSRTEAEKFARARPPRFWRSKTKITPADPRLWPKPPADVTVEPPAAIGSLMP